MSIPYIVSITAENQTNHIESKDAYLAGNGEADGLDDAVGNLVGSGNLAVVDVQAALGHEAKTTLRNVRAVLGQQEHFIVLILVVANVSITRKLGK
jgi:hypothetical protein